MHLDPSVTVMRCPLALLALLDVTATSYEKYGQYNVVNWPPHASPTPALTLKLTKRWFSRGVIGTIREIEHASNYMNLWNSVV